MLIDSRSRYVLQRFSLKVVLLSEATLMQLRAPWGMKAAATMLALSSALASVAFAAFLRERPGAPVFNYWDEAVSFLAIAVAVQLLP